MKISKDRYMQEELLTELTRRGKESFLNSLPMPRHQHEELLGFLYEQLKVNRCDRSFILTETFLDEHHIEKEKVIAWLEENGWHCDCEILRNTGEKTN